MGLIKHMAKEFFKEVDDKSREFFEFVLPPIDLHEKNGNLVVTVDIPGFDKNDIKVSMNGNVLSINAEKKEPNQISYREDTAFFLILTTLACSISRLLLEE